MAFFNSPTAFFIGNTNPKEKRFEKNLLKAAKKNGYDKFIEPCSGELAMSQLAIEAGFFAYRGKRYYVVFYVARILCRGQAH